MIPTGTRNTFTLISLLLLRLNFPKQSRMIQSGLIDLIDRAQAGAPQGSFQADPRAIVQLFIETAVNSHALGEIEGADP